MRAEYDAGEVRLLLPLSDAQAWAASDEISIKNTQPLGAFGELCFLLVEKDFVCLKPRQHEVEKTRRISSSTRTKRTEVVVKHS